MQPWSRLKMKKLQIYPYLLTQKFIKPPIAILIFAHYCKYESKGGHYRFHETKLQCCFFAKSKKFDGVLLPSQTTSACPQVRRTNRFSTNFRHYIRLATQILVTKTNMVIKQAVIVIVIYIILNWFYKYLRKL